MQRKGLMPSFQFRHIKLLYPIFWTKSVEMADGMERQLQSPSAKKHGIQIRDWSHRSTCKYLVNLLPRNHMNNQQTADIVHVFK
jgi:hypothetical protein